MERLKLFSTVFTIKVGERKQNRITLILSSREQGGNHLREKISELIFL